ncbi:MAG: CHRD domain-containing protein [Sphingomonas sp.]
MHRFVKVALLTAISTAVVGAANRPNIATFTIPLSGQEEVNVAHPLGGTGDLQASGSVSLSIDTANKQVCYDFRLSSHSEPMMAHIHEGSRLRNGPPVIILFAGTGMSLADCAPSTREQLSEIVANPSRFYVSLDTTAYPDGALRGQL